MHGRFDSGVKETHKVREGTGRGLQSRENGQGGSFEKVTLSEEGRASTKALWQGQGLAGPREADEEKQEGTGDAGPGLQGTSSRGASGTLALLPKGEGNAARPCSRDAGEMRWLGQGESSGCDGKRSASG